ncbi:hypothetical protein P8C59_009267 [Phyllachora maydis]|uniref:Mannosyl phosphorylinositol ceramide synthase SUR1 n=1 Tax=Phyllachora maydis TaxID=1825666 RepID=A0AAD9IDB3_9PEZI|nr:hypothetical protein P8C59_009267 [Phyllachora maydis]
MAALSRLVAFLSLFGGPHSGIRITQEAAARAHHNGSDARLQVVPRIIHQIFHDWKNPGNEKLPSDWEDVRQTCLSLNPGWDYKLWTEPASREFLSREYPTFLKTYDGYRYPVQRVDALRYFLMLHYGGIYLDLDNGCSTSLEPLLYYPLWTTDGGRGTLSNNILGARPHHPFWEQLTQDLPRCAINYILPYLTISYASGQWFLTEVWEKYHAALPAASRQGDGDGDPRSQHRLYQVMMDMRPGADPWVFFTQGRGGTWNNWDNYIFAWLGNLSQSIPVLMMLVLLPCALLSVLHETQSRVEA